MTVTAGFDFGTSSVKLVVATSDGTVLARGQAAYPTAYGQAGVAEQNAEDWWNAARDIVAETGLGTRIDAIGVTGQMQDLITVAGGRATRPVLLYSDTRAGAQHARLRAGHPDWERATSNHQDVTSVASKIAWLADHEPAVLSGAESLLFGAPGYISWRATGVAACDIVTASATGLLDVRRRGWLDELVAAAGARSDQMPALVGTVESDALIGPVCETAAAELGVRAGIPLVHAMGDAGSTTDGIVGSDPGHAYIYLGTTGWLAAVTASAPDARPSPIHSLVMPGWDTRLRIGAVQSAGSAADWSRRTFLPGLDFTGVEALAESRVADPAAIAVRPLALPGITGERSPVRNADFRGAFVGVHEATQPIDFHLAVLTGVAFALRHVADDLGLVQRRIPLVGGAAASPAWRRILADVFEATIVTREEHDPGTRSALRAVVTALRIPHRVSPLFTPGDRDIETPPSDQHAMYASSRVAHRRLYEALAPTFQLLAREQ